MVAAMILSAGLGTRLRPLSSWRAKPLVPVGDRPVLAHIVLCLRAVSRVIVVNAHHRADEVAAYAREAGLVVSREDDLQGTAGGLHHAADALGVGDVLVWNGDMIGELDAEALVAAHARNAAGGALATLVVRPRDDHAGNTGIDPVGDVVRLRRETCRDGEARTADFLGIYVIGAEMRRALPPRGGVIEDGFLPAIHRGARVATFACEVPFLDVGTPRAYLEANLRWLSSRGLSAWTAERARVGSDVTLDRSVIGANARVVGEGRLEACVVWPGAEVRAPLANAVVAPEGVVPIVTEP